MRYRIYGLGCSGEIVSGGDLAATHDDQSIEEAAEHPNRYGLEVWQGNRKVAVLSPPSPHTSGISGCNLHSNAIALPDVSCILINATATSRINGE